MTRHNLSCLLALAHVVVLFSLSVSASSSWFSDTLHHARLLPRHKYHAWHRRFYASDSQVDSWIEGTGPFPYPYDPPDTPSSVAQCQAGISYPNPTSPSNEDLNKRDQFVTRSGTRLELGGNEFRPVGPNIYWLGLDENVIPDPSYPTQTRVLEVMGIASAMGANTIRSHTLGISFGNSLSVEPSPGNFNEDAYDAIDFAIMAARIYGLKLIIPLVDNYNWYHGGKYQFIGWAGHQWSGQGAAITPPDVGAFFYNDTNCVNMYIQYIQHHLNHVNTYTGVALKDDPTIMAWETGNELSAVLQSDGPPPASWTTQIAQTIKSLASNHLIVDGTYGIYPSSGQLQVSQIDIFSDHFYPMSVSKFQQDVNEANGVGRVFLAGEYDWTGQNGGDNIQSFLNAVQSADGSGDLFWSLFGHDTDCCTLVQHNDGYTYYYPGTTSNMVNQGQAMISHFHNMESNDPPQVLPRVACATTTVSTLPTTTSTTSTTTTSTTTTTTTTTTSHTTTTTGGPSSRYWTSSACVAEPTQQVQSIRALTGYSTQSSAMTVELCTQTCQSQGYSLAGVEYSTQCYCGNALANGAAVTNPSACNMACAGNSQEECGGSWILNVYTLASGTSTTTSTSTTSHTTTTSTTPTTTSHTSTTTTTSTTPTSTSHSSTTTTSTTPTSTSHSSTTTTTTTTHSSTPTSTSTTTSTTTSPPAVRYWSSSACVAEPTQQVDSIRALTGYSTTSSAMTVELCTQACANQGFTLAGLEYGDQCYCGNSLMNGASVVANTECNMLCAGNTGEACGAGWTLNVYTLTSGSSSTTTTTTASGSPTWTSSACVAEPTQHVSSIRALTGYSITSSAMTVQVCTQACANQGFSLAGLEYGDECYCGNALANGASVVSNSQCNMGCAGNGGEECGSGWILNVYGVSSPPSRGDIMTSTTTTSSTTTTRTTSTSTTPTTTSTTTHSTTSTSTTPTTTSTTTHSTTSTSTTPTTTSTTTHSTTSTSTTPTSTSTTTHSTTSTSTSSTSSTTHSTTTPPPTTTTHSTTSTTTTSTSTSASASLYWTSSACVAEPTQHVDSIRALSGYSVTSSIMTVELCAQACASQGFTLAGTEYGDQCYCGDSLSNGASVVADSACNMACAGNSQELCGAGWTLSVYKLSGSAPSSTWTSLGCLGEPSQHNPSVRALTGANEQTSSTTVESCVTWCSAQGYTYAGLEFGDQCYCGIGISNGAQLTSTSDCNMPCAGNSGETCGGNWALSLYSKSGGSAKRSRGAHLGRRHAVIGGVEIIH